MDLLQHKLLIQLADASSSALLYQSVHRIDTTSSFRQVFAELESAAQFKLAAVDLLRGDEQVGIIRILKAALRPGSVNQHEKQA